MSDRLTGTVCGIVAASIWAGATAMYLPVYLVFRGGRLIHLPLGELALQGAYQGVAVTIVSLVFYGRAVALLGAAAGAAFGALVPALAALLAIPLLGEWPGKGIWAGIMLVSVAVYLASGGSAPFSARLRRG